MSLTSTEPDVDAIDYMLRLLALCRHQRNALELLTDTLLERRLEVTRAGVNA